MKHESSSDTRAWSRREFLQRSSIAVAGLAFIPRLAAARESKSKDAGRKIRMGVVGGGFGADFYWHMDPNSVVVAVSDLIPERRERLKKVYKCDRAYDSLEKLVLDKEVEAVAVFTGAPDHVRHAVACMNEGKHVVSAVPAATEMEDAQLLYDTVKKTGLTYMMAETSYFHQEAISVRDMYQKGEFGRIFYTEAEYLHPGLESLWFDKNGKPTWRHGAPPMHYPTHMTAFVVGITGERLVDVSCLGWTDNSPLLKDNRYGNPYWNEVALFRTSGDNSMRAIYVKRGACRGCERAQWYGEKMSFFAADPKGYGPVIIRNTKVKEKDDGGFERTVAQMDKYDQPQYWKTDMLPEPLRINSGHGQSQTFLTHEFIDALVNNRAPAIDIYESLAMTVPGIVAHESAMRGGERLKVPSFDRKT